MILPALISTQSLKILKSWRYIHGRGDFISDKVKFELSRSQDYKVVYINGVFGGLSPEEGRMLFYIDRLVPEVLNDPAGVMKLQKIDRELIVDVRMSAAQFRSIADWMLSHVRDLDEALKKGVAKEVSDTSKGMYG